MKQRFGTRPPVSAGGVKRSATSRAAAGHVQDIWTLLKIFQKASISYVEITGGLPQGNPLYIIIYIYILYIYLYIVYIRIYIYICNTYKSDASKQHFGAISFFVRFGVPGIYRDTIWWHITEDITNKCQQYDTWVLPKLGTPTIFIVYFWWGILFNPWMEWSTLVLDSHICLPSPTKQLHSVSFIFIIRQEAKDFF